MDRVLTESLSLCKDSHAVPRTFDVVFHIAIDSLKNQVDRPALWSILVECEDCCPDHRVL